MIIIKSRLIIRIIYFYNSKLTPKVNIKGNILIADTLDGDE